MHAWIPLRPPASGRLATPRRFGQPGGLALLVTALLLLVSACASDESAAAGGGGGGGGTSISFTEPAGGAEVTSPVAFTLVADGVEIGEPETGNMHFHIRIDDGSDYQIVYATSGEIEVPEGEHTLRATLAQPNHNETDTTTEVTVNVSGSGPSQAPAEDDSSDSPYGY